MMSSHLDRPTGFELTVLREDSSDVAAAELRVHASHGLSSEPKALSSKYLYDDAGSGMSMRTAKQDHALKANG